MHITKCVAAATPTELAWPPEYPLLIDEANY